jgi:hypothetical protein
MHHFAWTKGGATVQVHGMGPFVLNHVNPADDPSKGAPAPVTGEPSAPGERDPGSEPGRPDRGTNGWATDQGPGSRSGPSGTRHGSSGSRSDRLVPRHRSSGRRVGGLEFGTDGSVCGTGRPGTGQQSPTSRLTLKGASQRCCRRRCRPQRFGLVRALTFL